jgi:hypothetical protein
VKVPCWGTLLLVVLLGGTLDDNPLTLSKASLVEVDEDMTPLDTTFDYKVSSFLCLYNDKTKNLLPPNISILNVLRIHLKKMENTP